MADKYQEQRASEPAIDQASIRKIIADGDAKILVDEARQFGVAAKNYGLTKSQIRGVFGTVRQIQASWDNEKSDPKQNLRKVLLLKPRLAYQGVRQAPVKPLAKVLTAAIDLVAEGKDADEQKRRFGYFVDLFEAILAYHTEAGGK
jgi:CRISPR-associated protein Csm2